jgi:DNA processing protein
MVIGGKTVEHFDASEVREIEIDDRNYPELLKRIKKPPKALRVRGNLPPNRQIIAISGSRKPTQQALATAFKIGKMLAEHGYTIVTGLAEGCDEAAVEGALSANGNVIGIVPRGLKALPTHTKKLAQDIFATGGAVISEYADNASKAISNHYLRRNEIITGLSEKTIIIAAEERSGSSATANHALRQGREVIITRHVKAKIEGATLVKNLRDLKDVLGLD